LGENIHGRKLVEHRVQSTSLILQTKSPKISPDSRSGEAVLNYLYFTKQLHDVAKPKKQDSSPESAE
jgi:hypothetical protein